MGGPEGKQHVGGGLEDPALAAGGHVSVMYPSSSHSFLACLSEDVNHGDSKTPGAHLSGLVCPLFPLQC